MSETSRLPVTLQPVDGNNWRAVASLEVTPEQRAFVAQPSYYLALCCYDSWNSKGRAKPTFSSPPYREPQDATDEPQR